MVKNKKTLLILSLVLVLALGGFAYYYLSDQEYPQNEVGEYITDDTQTNKKTQKDNAQEGTSSKNDVTPPPPKSDGSTSSPSRSTLLKPEGSFVSSHNVKANSNIESVCITSPGAKCKIVLTKNGAVKTLASKTADSDGATRWLWQPKKIGISSGSWTIKAVASSSGQSKTTKDPIPLEITP